MIIVRFYAVFNCFFNRVVICDAKRSAFIMKRLC